MKGTQTIALTLLAAGALTASAQTYRPAVAVTCKVEDGDRIGARFCSAVRDAVARSPRYRIVYDDKAMHLTINVLSTRIGDSDVTSAEAIVYTLDDTNNTASYLNSAILVTGSNRVVDQANDVFAEFDQLITSYMKK